MDKPARCACPPLQCFGTSGPACAAVQDRTSQRDKRATVSGAAAATAPRYRLLMRGERVQLDDERLNDDCETWAPVERWTFSCGYDPVCFVPMRRRVDALPQSEGPNGGSP